MTSGNVNNFVSDLVLMAKAMEELPGVRSELEHAHTQVEEYAKQVQRLEMSLIDRKHEIEALHAKVRSTEAERDDAELRFLDLDEKSAKAIRFLAQIQGMAVQAEITLVPPKPEPVPEPQAEPEVKYDEPIRMQGQSDYTPTEPSSTTDGGGIIGSHSLPVTSFEEVPKSDANPSQDTALARSIDSGDTALHSGASTIENASAPVTIEQSSPVDDVGYHNEPDVGTDWTAWNAWCERMRARYGAGAWPQRPDNAAPSVA